MISAHQQALLNEMIASDDTILLSIFAQSENHTNNLSEQSTFKDALKIDLLRYVECVSQLQPIENPVTMDDFDTITLPPADDDFEDD